MKKPDNVNVAKNQKDLSLDRKNALIARLIAGAQLDFSCCGHAKPKERPSIQN